MGLSPMQTPEGPLNWNAASVDLPPIPMIAPGADAMSMTIAGVLPTLTVPLTASVAALSAKENTFSGKVTSADSAYQNSDQSGGQSVGQMGQMLGQLGQMAQQASGPAQALSGQSGTFGSMMQQAMQAAEGGGSQGGGSPNGGATGSSSAGAPPSASQAPTSQATSGQGGAGQPTPAGQATQDRDENRDEERRRLLDHATAGPDPHGAGPAPVTPPEHPRHGDDEDLSRRT